MWKTSNLRTIITNFHIMSHNMTLWNMTFKPTTKNWGKSPRINKLWHMVSSWLNEWHAAPNRVEPILVYSDHHPLDRKTHLFDPIHHLLQNLQVYHLVICHVPSTNASKTQNQLEIVEKSTIKHNYNEKMFFIYKFLYTLIAALAQLQCYHFIWHFKWIFSTYSRCTS